MDTWRKKLPGIILLTLGYPLMAYVIQYIPNPIVPGALLALNMIFIILAGFFYGPISGALAGCLGTALAALLRADMYDALAIFPHLVMGLAAGLAGNKRSDVLGALSILIGHGLNLLFYWRFGLLDIATVGVNTLLLGLASESMVDIVAIVLLIALLKRWLYQIPSATGHYRW